MILRCSLLILIACIFLIGCSGEQATQETTKAPVEKTAPAKKAMSPAVSSREDAADEGEMEETMEKMEEGAKDVKEEMKETMEETEEEAGEAMEETEKVMNKALETN